MVIKPEEEETKSLHLQKDLEVEIGRSIILLVQELKKHYVMLIETDVERKEICVGYGLLVYLQQLN